MNGFALGRAFQAVGNDLGVSSQIQFNQSMESQMGAQRAAMDNAHNQFMQNMASSRTTSEANQTAAKLGQQKSEFNATSAANATYHAGMLKNTANANATRNRAASAEINRNNAETTKLLQASGGTNVRPSMQQITGLLNTKANLYGRISANQQKVSGLSSLARMKLAKSDAQMQAEIAQIDGYLNPHGASASPPGAPTPAPAPAAYPAIPAPAVDFLKQNPSPQNRAYFDQTFGTGAASRTLGAPSG